MKIITEPTVYLTGKQTVVQAEVDRFLADNGVEWQTDSEVGAEVIIETAGRVCYMSYAKPRPGGNEAYIKHIKETGHGSVVEHAVWNLLFTGISRSLSHELVRHRAGWAYSQLSQRYVDESVCEVVVPDALKEEVRLAQAMIEHRYGGSDWDHELIASGVAGNWGPITKQEQIGLIWIANMLRNNHDYRYLSDYLFDKNDRKTREAKVLEPGGVGVLSQAEKTAVRKDARQAARSVLPNATETKVYVTVNARAARHFIEMRAAKPADPEIRKLAVAMYDVLVADAPNIFGDYIKTTLLDGTFELGTPYKKV